MAFSSFSVTRVRDIPYYVPPTRFSIPPASRRLIFGTAPDFEDALVPVSLLVFPDGANVSGQNLTSLVDSYLRADDVFSPSFLQHIYLLTSPRSEFVNLDNTTLDNTTLDNTTLDSSTFAVLGQWGTQSVHAVMADPGTELPGLPGLPGGPYFASARGLRQAWRLFDDTNGAFMFPVVPVEGSSDAFAIPATAGVPVPSRLYSDKPSSSKPLSGLRVGIKDNIDVKGVRTSAGNRAYQELYPPRDQNAVCVQKLLDAGAVIVGKTKTVQFASGENAKDWFDYQAPFNPRGDGYLDPGCSSTGSAVAMSAYDWVDLTLGTDTFGSVLGPAADHGLFGLRPSLDSLSTEGVVPLSAVVDTIGIFARSSQLAAQAAKVLYGPELDRNSCSASFKLMYPTDIFAGYPPQYRAYVEPILNQLERFLDVKRLKIDIGALFKEQSVAGGISMQEYLKNTTAHIQLYDCYNNLLPFRYQYLKKFHKKPFVDPYIFYKWSLGERLSKDQYETAVSERNVFGNWMRDVLLPQPPKGRNFDKILVMPSGRFEPSYRNVYDGQTLEEGARRKQGFGFKDQALSVLTGLPFFTIPIGQYSYISTVTERKEWIPAAIAFVGPKGSEIEMLELLHEFLGTPGLHNSVQTGSTAFPIEDFKISSSL